jgi:TusA-related sulfurtransferase
MPIVPQAQRQVQTKVLQAQHVSTDAKLELFGGGNEKVGEAASFAFKEVGNAVDRIDELEAQRALAQAVKKKNSLLLGDPDDPDSDGGYFSRQGKNAMSDMDTYKQRLSLSFKEIEDGLSNERQKARYRQSIGQIDLEVDGQMKRHALGEAQRYDEQESMAALKAHQDDAVINYKDLVTSVDKDGNPTQTSKIRLALQKQEEIIKGFAARKGFDENSEFTKQKILESKTMTHKGIIERMLANDEDLYAQEYLNQVKESGEVDGNSLPDLEKLVEAGTLRGESQRWTDKIMDQNVGMGTALEQARSIEDPKLRDEVTQRLKVRFAEANAVKEDQEQKNFDVVADHIEQFKSRDKIPADQWLRLSNAQRSAIDTRISQLNSGKHIVTDQEKYYDLRLMAASPQTRDKFAKMNLYVSARPYMNDKDYNKLVELQAGIIKNDEATLSRLDGFRSDNQVVNDSLKAVGIDPKKKPELYSQFATKIDSLVEQWKEQNGGKTIPNTELKKIIDNQLIEGTVPGTGIFGTSLFKTKKRLFQLEKGEELEISVDKLPKEDVSQITRALKKNGKPVTDANIIELYQRVRLKNRKS